MPPEYRSHAAFPRYPVVLARPAVLNADAAHRPMVAFTVPGMAAHILRQPT